MTVPELQDLMGLAIRDVSSLLVGEGSLQIFRLLLVHLHQCVDLSLKVYQERVEQHF